MNIKETMLSRREEVSIQLKNLEKEFENHAFPQGRMELYKNGNSYKCFEIIDHKRKYIPKKNKELIKTLAQKKYYEKQIYSLKSELKAIDAYLKRLPKDTFDEYLKNSREYKTILFPEYKTIEDELQQWANEEYEKNTNYEDGLRIKTLKGDLVRSKSEAMIADELYRNGIPYRYECATDVSGSIMYPDFIARNKRTGQIFIWEHYGLMDDENYIQSYLYKTGKYLEAGFVETVNMLATYETSYCPLDSIKVGEIIKAYLV